MRSIFITYDTEHDTTSLRRSVLVLLRAAAFGFPRYDTIRVIYQKYLWFLLDIVPFRDYNEVTN